ncbi:protein moonraker isoform X2 [Boleophthalmus pectinirostris]|uniref:protein moonraker isoform X2 n=1 Tax=Boleophthalmus pectinirostris TaxID=150288 RepID=UPI00242CDDA3|nr:protein moonraker isoform X2 [Boleophthalmus pectinirostris]
MTAEYFQSSPVTSQQKEWVVVNTDRNVNDSRERSSSKTGSKLLFNEAIPASTSNRATCVDPPTSIVIEKLLPLPEERTFQDNSKSSISFTVLSEEQLNAAVKLAKRDLRRRLLDSLNRSSLKHMQNSSLLETSDVELLQDLGATPNKIQLKASSPKETKPRGRLIGHMSHKSPTTRRPSPTGSHGLPEHNHLVHEIHNLQHELEFCIQKAVELASREQKVGEPPEPDEQSKLDIRKQKQAARSTSIIYTLQHQVKEVQENLEKAHYQKTKSTSLKRLAAVHRGVLRALHVFIQQLSDTTHCTNLPNFKDLGQLIRQLCLCSTKAELSEGSAVPQSALDILQKLEMLDSALYKQDMLRKMQVQACPPPRESHHSTSIRAARGANAFIHHTTSNSVKAAKNVKGKKKAARKPKAVSHVLTQRRDVLRAGVEKLAQQREQENKAEGNFRKTTLYNVGVISRNIPNLNKAHNTNFLQPTVSSRLRENQLPQKEQAVPWIPTSPHAPRQQFLQPKTRPEPRCLFTPEKNPQRSAKVRSRFKAESSLNLEKKQQAQEEAMRRIWLDKMTMQRLKELQQLSEEEPHRLQLLRSKVISPTQWAGGEQKATEHVQPLLDQAQSAESAEQLSDALLEDLLEDTARVAWAVQTDKQLEGRAQRRMQSSTLENMLIRMEEIQRDQEEVRRRVTSIIYSDPLNLDKPQDTGKDSGSRPSSPQPIRLTQPELRQRPSADIILEKPLETGAFIETRSPEEEGSQVRRSAMFPVAVQRGRGAILSVPSHTLRNIRQYREDYEAYRSTGGKRSFGGVTPWTIADSLAEELLAEVVTEVAAEFQDVVEEYAEAVFTSEFLQPVQSPAPPTQAIT